MKKEEPIIVIDNTNVRKWEAKPYVKMAQQYGYEVKFVEPDTPWKFDITELKKKDNLGAKSSTSKPLSTAAST